MRSSLGSLRAHPCAARWRRTASGPVVPTIQAIDLLDDLRRRQLIKVNVIDPLLGRQWPCANRPCVKPPSMTTGVGTARVRRRATRALGYLSSRVALMPPGKHGPRGGVGASRTDPTKGDPAPDVAVPVIRETWHERPRASKASRRANPIGTPSFASSPTKRIRSPTYSCHRRLAISNRERRPPCRPAFRQLSCAITLALRAVLFTTVASRIPARGRHCQLPSRRTATTVVACAHTSRAFTARFPCGAGVRAGGRRHRRHGDGPRWCACTPGWWTGWRGQAAPVPCGCRRRR